MPDVKTRMEWRHSSFPRAGSLGALAALSLLFSGCGLFITPQHRIAVARSELKAGQWQAAAGELRTVVQAHPDNAGAWQLLAEVSLDAGDISGAQSSIEHALAAGAKGSDLDALRLRVWLADGQPKAAIAAITGHSIHAGEPTQSLELARAELATGHADEALRILQPLLAAHPDLTEGRVVVAEALARQGHLDQALQQLDQAAQHDPKSAQPLLLKGRILAARGKYPAAEQALAAALARMPPAQPLLERIGALTALTEARLAQGKVAAAEKSQASLAAVAPGAPITQLLAGRIDLARGDVSGGLNELQAVLVKAPGLIAARLYLGAAELSQGHLQQSRQQLEQVVQASPDNIAARKLLATVRLRLGQPEAALSALTPALESQPADPGVLSLIGTASRRTGDSRSAVKALESQLQAHSKDEAAALNLAQLQAATGDLAAAKSTLSAALAAHPDALPVRFALAKVELAQGDIKEGEATLDQAIAAHPGQAPVVAAAGAVLLAAHQYDAALGRFAQATVLEPGKALYWLNSARAQLALNQTAAARESLLKAAHIQPDWLPAVGMLAMMDVHAGKGPAALARVNAVVARQRNDAPALALKGYVEAALGDSGAAMTAYARAQALHPTAQVAVQLYRARLAAHAADPQKPLEDWVAREPRDWRVHEILGEYYLGIHALHPAAGQLELTVQQSPNNVVALNNLAWIYGKLDDPRAESLAERAYKLAPKAPQVDDTYGWILAHRQQSARAVPLLARAAKLMPKDPEVEYHYAYALSSAGKTDEARRVLTRLLATSQTFQSRGDARRLLAALKHT